MFNPNQAPRGGEENRYVADQEGWKLTSSEEKERRTGVSAFERLREQTEKEEAEKKELN